MSKIIQYIDPNLNGLKSCPHLSLSYLCLIKSLSFMVKSQGTHYIVLAQL